MIRATIAAWLAGMCLAMIVASAAEYVERGLCARASAALHAAAQGIRP